MSAALGLVFFAAATTGCATAGGGSEAAGSAGSAGEGEPAPELTVNGFWDKKPIHLSAYRGKVVLLDIWASWCTPCKEEMPQLDALAARLRGKGVEILAVSIDEDRPAAESFLKTRRKWSLTLAHDPAGAVPERLQPPKMPTSYIIDSKGIVRHVNAGFNAGDADKLEAQLLALAR
jgi:cytochrome c biogenesis protein CcmG/thiol:disulfide interchange protein DsbE